MCACNFDTLKEATHQASKALAQAQHRCAGNEETRRSEREYREAANAVRRAAGVPERKYKAPESDEAPGRGHYITQAWDAQGDSLGLFAVPDAFESARTARGRFLEYILEHISPGASVDECTHTFLWESERNAGRYTFIALWHEWY